MFFDITKTDLMRQAVDGQRRRKRREYLGETWRIGYCNGKQLIRAWNCLEFVWPKSKRPWPVIKTEVEEPLPKLIRKEKYELQIIKRDQGDAGRHGFS